MRGEQTATAYARRFAELKASLPGAGVGWLDELRARALERFLEAGIPSRKVEAYKYTNLAPLVKTVYETAPRDANGVRAEAYARYLLDDQAGPLLVFVDGRYRADLSRPGTLPAGATVISLAEALETRPETLEGHLGDGEAFAERSLVAFNAAFMRDGAVVRLDAGVALESPIQVLFLATHDEAPTAYALRNLVIAERGSRAVLLETYAGPGSASYWTNAVTRVWAAEGAAIRHYRLQAEGAGAIHLGATEVELTEASAYASFALSLGGRLSRHDIAARLEGGGIDCGLSGAYLARGRQHTDTSTWIDHARPGSRSREVYKGVLDDAARGVFHGKITVREKAQRTDAHQLNKNLLLSESAEVDTKPELEIYADDVKCSHGATAGELDAEALFYLRSRGIEEGRARHLLVEAFVADVLDDIGSEAVRSHFGGIVSAWLARPEPGEGREG